MTGRVFAAVLIQGMVRLAQQELSRQPEGTMVEWADLSRDLHRTYLTASRLLAKELNRRDTS